MEDEIEDIDLSENDESLESTTEEVEDVQDQDDSVEDTTDWKAEALKQKAINARLAKKLDKPQQAPVEQQQINQANYLSREEGILIAQGMNPEDLDELKAVADAKGVSLLKAKETPLFQGYLEKMEADRKKEKAKLGSSKGSQVQQTVSISELSPEDHAALVKEKMANVR